MAKLILYLALLLLRVAGVACIDIDDLFTVQSGTTNGGCDSYRDELENYLQEAIDSLTAAVDAIDQYSVGSADGKRVMDAVLAFFGYKSKQGATTVQTTLKQVQEFVNGEITNIDKATTFLFCDSDWLELKQPTDQAQDWQGANIVAGGKAVAIQAIPAYEQPIKAGQSAWWSGTGESPVVQGYYFTGEQDNGGNYCSVPTNYGLTTTITSLQQQQNGQVTQGPPVQTIMLCPQSFKRDDVAASFEAGDGDITAGSSLEPVTPRSSTFVHELFHLLQGTNFLQGPTEIYGLVTCVQASMAQPAKAKKNPENYVFFTAAMYYLFGSTLDQVPPETTDITVYWDFTDGPDKAKGPIGR